MTEARGHARIVAARHALSAALKALSQADSSPDSAVAAVFLLEVRRQLVAAQTQLRIFNR